MTERHLAIGELGKLTGTKVETIRYYERIGLLAAPKRTTGNYRAYGPAHLSRLSFIRRSRDLGFSLDQVRALLDLSDDRDRPCEAVDVIAKAHLAEIDRKIADNALGALEVDSAGLDAMDRRYLTTIALNYGGGPVGVETMAAALSEPRDAIEDIIEPYLIQKGFVQRTPRGRMLTSHAFKHLGLAEPARDASQIPLFDQGDDA